MIRVLKETLQARSKEEDRNYRREEKTMEDYRKRDTYGLSKSDQKFGSNEALSPYFSNQRKRRFDYSEDSGSKRKLKFGTQEGVSKTKRDEIFIDEDGQSFSHESDRYKSDYITKSKQSVAAFSGRKPAEQNDKFNESKTLKDYLSYSETEEDERSGRASWIKGDNEDDLMIDIKNLDQEIAEIQNCLAQQLSQNL
jgi:hypothetical protein